MLKVEFHVPISPTPNFLCMVHYLAASIDLFSGLDRSEYRVVATVGAEEQVDLALRCPWAEQYGLEWRWVEHDLFRDLSYFATGNQRLRYRYESDTVVLLDADVIVTGSLREAAARAAASGAVHGLPAYASPFLDHLHVRGHRAWWREMFRAGGLGDPVFEMEHSGWNLIHTDLRDPELRCSPIYLNYGFLAAAPEIVSRLGDRIYDDIGLVGRVLEMPYKAQVAVALAIERRRIPWQPFPIEYNFPNTPEFFDNFPDRARDIRVFHYGQTSEIDKRRDFASYGHVETMLEREGFSPVNRALAARLAEIHRLRVAPDLQRYGITVAKPPVDYFVLERKRDRARQQVDCGEMAEAYESLREIADLLPDDAHVQYLFAYAMHCLGIDPPEAERRYRLALERGFDEFWVRYNLGALQLRAGSREAGIANLRRARVLNPGHAGVDILLGGVEAGR